MHTDNASFSANVNQVYGLACKRNEHRLGGQYKGKKEADWLCITIYLGRFSIMAIYNNSEFAHFWWYKIERPFLFPFCHFFIHLCHIPPYLITHLKTISMHYCFTQYQGSKSWYDAPRNAHHTNICYCQAYQLLLNTCLSNVVFHPLFSWLLWYILNVSNKTCLL